MAEGKKDFSRKGGYQGGFGMTYILHLAVETAAIQTKPAYAGYKTPDLRLVRVGGLGLYSLRILF